MLLGDLFKNVDKVESRRVETAPMKCRQSLARFPFDALKELRHSLSCLIVQRLDLFTILMSPVEEK